MLQLQEGPQDSGGELGPAVRKAPGGVEAVRKGSFPEEGFEVALEGRGTISEHREVGSSSGGAAGRAQCCTPPVPSASPLGWLLLFRFVLSCFVFCPFTNNETEALRKVVCQGLLHRS